MNKLHLLPAVARILPNSEGVKVRTAKEVLLHLIGSLWEVRDLGYLESQRCTVQMMLCSQHR